MTEPTDDAIYQQRLAVYTLVRFVGVAIFFFGIAVAYSNLLRPGGWPQLGAIIAIVGALGSLLLPRVVKRAWDHKERGDQ
jgi:hypothetical protein